MKKKETMRSIFCGLTAGVLFLGLLLGMDWNFLVAALLAAGLFEGIYLVTKPKKISGKTSGQRGRGKNVKTRTMAFAS